MLEAAVLGHGIALAKSTIAAADVPDGWIAQRFEVTLECPDEEKSVYYVVYPESKSVMPKVGVFLRWLREEVAPPAAKGPPRLLAVPGSRAPRPANAPVKAGQKYLPSAIRRASA